MHPCTYSKQNYILITQLFTFRLLRERERARTVKMLWLFITVHFYRKSLFIFFCSAVDLRFFSLPFSQMVSKKVLRLGIDKQKSIIGYDDSRASLAYGIYG